MQTFKTNVLIQYLVPSTCFENHVFISRKTISTCSFYGMFFMHFTRVSSLAVWSSTCCTGYINTGHFMMYSGITKIYYRKTVGHVFTKPVQIEGTTQNLFPQ
jgi:hypothetical protein